VKLKLSQAFDLAAIARDQGKKGRVEFQPVATPLWFETALYRAINRAVLAPYTAARQEILEAAKATKATLTQDAFSLSDVMSALRGSFTQAARLSEGPMRSLFEGEARRHDEKWIDQVNRVIGIDLKAVVSSRQIAPAIDLAVQGNVALIKGLSDDVAKRVETTIIDLVTRGASTKEISKALTDIGGFTKGRAQLIAITEANKFNGQLNRIRQEQAGVTRYTWSTARDNRVRPSHRAREGQTYRWDTPPAGGPPGSEPRCRCIARAVLDLDEGKFRRSERQRAGREGLRAVEAALGL
jgi:SPP1 gp7 family putative phage head morphogenesis protein